ncbi:hypothetical protein GTP44_15505 [Duganella sp. FT50W]|uniref:Novel STAND NTPase 3 domain-containing protein n=1 Tax=Duganella lactea TaxID=2692173 RepID=A0A6L8MKE5_9BURK|nr:hypothetical protein [Duganella lactea]MYM83353.1 hypothetical protein [Duganella lactea]
MNTKQPHLNEPNPVREAQGYHADFALHTLGWKAFQDLCAQVMEEEIQGTVSIYREAQDGGQDAVFLATRLNGKSTIGTVQCKFSSKADRRLKAADITGELQNVTELVAKGLASRYYFITSMGIDADIGTQIRKRLVELGVEQAHVLGREWLFLKIRGSPRLRALVPRVYGLGDLSTILDDRCAQQTAALLGSHQKALNVYVPTAPHRAAVNILAEHKLVLLLGAPATGKSTLAAILATLAVDKDEVEVFKCEGPMELRRHWNPHETKRLFWVDDAFGSNLLMPDYVNAWLEFMPKLKTAIEHGCHFILTSRTHIWNEAKPRLGSRNHQLLANDVAVVNVGELSHSEREQILYNHLKVGNQPAEWKVKIREHLPELSKEKRLLPELARRLGDSTYTAHIRALPDDLRRFISEPQKFLVQTFEELNVPQRAALTLVFLSQSRLPVYLFPETDVDLLAKNYGVSKAQLTESLMQLADSLVVRRRDGPHEYWAFWHPTFADAISEILSKRPDLISVFVRGAKLDTLFSEAVSEGATYVRDAVVVPMSCSDDLIERLLETPDETRANQKLFHFLNHRLPAELVKKILERAPELLERDGHLQRWMRFSGSEEVVLRATAHSMHLLDDSTRYATVDMLEHGALHSFEMSFVHNDSVLALFKPSELMHLSAGLLATMDSAIASRIEHLQSQADPNNDVESQFEEITNFLADLRELAESDIVFEAQHKELWDTLQAAIAEVQSHKSSDPEEESIFWNAPAAVQREHATGRSLFSDVDE